MDLLSWRVFDTCDFLKIIHDIKHLFYFQKNCLFNDNLRSFFSCFVDYRSEILKKIKKSHNSCVKINKYFVSNYILFMCHTFSIISHILLVFRIVKWGKRWTIPTNLLFLSQCLNIKIDLQAGKVYFLTFSSCFFTSYLQPITNKLLKTSSTFYPAKWGKYRP